MRLILQRPIFVLLLLLLSPAFGVRGLTEAASPAGQQTAVAQEATVGAAARIEPLRGGFNFPTQTLRYEAEYRFWTAGVAALKVQRSGAQMQVSATADS